MKLTDAQLDSLLEHLLELKREGLLGPRCPCCGERLRDGCAAHCVIGMPAQPKQGTPEHAAVCEYAAQHELNFDCAHAELEALRSRRARGL